MSRRIVVVVAWLVATLTSILIATAAVGSVRNNVSETPSPLRSVGVTRVVEAGSASAAPGLSSTTATPPAATTSPPTPTSTTSTTTTTVPPGGSNATPPAATTSTAATTTTAPPQTTTTEAPVDEISTHVLIGGTTTISTDGAGVYLVAAVPKSGFQVEVEDSGSQVVDVRYRSEDHKSTFKAQWEHGELNIETEESDGDDD